MPKLLGGAADSSLPVPFLAPPFSSKFNIQLLAGGHRIRYRWRLVGDITPIDGVNTNNWLGKASSKEIKDCEYEDHEATDSEFVHDVDKIELILQMVEYEQLRMVGHWSNQGQTGIAVVKEKIGQWTNSMQAKSSIA
jgi:hypothetical protein